MIENENYNDYTLFYHEDDYGQVELLPTEDIPYIQNELDDIENMLANQKSNSSGFENIHLRKNTSHGLKIRKIVVSDLEQVLSSIRLPKHTEVGTGYGAKFRVKSKETIGYGEGSAAVFFQYFQDQVELIWFTSPEQIANQPLFVNALNELGIKHKLVLIDWSYGILVNLQKKEEIETYFSKLK